MKKILIVVIVVIMLFGFVTPVLAGGDQNTGGTGNGKGDQQTHEVGCEDQPCFYDAPQPKNGK